MFWKKLRNLFYKPHTPDRLLSLAEFRQMVVSATRMEFPDVIITTPVPDEIHFSDNGVSGTFPLKNSYQLYCADPQRLDELSLRLVASIQDKRQFEPGTLRQHLMPVIEDVGYIQRLANSTGLEPDLYFEPLNDKLIIVYANDRANSLYYVSRGFIEEAGIALDEVRAIATANLAWRAKDKIRVVRRKGINQIILDGTYEPSLLLLPEVFQDRRLKFKGDPVIAIPAHGALLVTGSENTIRLITLQSLAADIARNSPYPITRKLFQWSAGQWKSEGGLEYVTFAIVNGEVVQLD
jgi:uncharacterized protein YtpQ (UPF0354 family)